MVDTADASMQAGLPEVHLNTPVEDIPEAEDMTRDQGVPFWIDPFANDVDRGIEGGMRVSDGDGTVNLLSLGYMCQQGWKAKGKRNPQGIKVLTREYDHQPSNSIRDPRGGVSSGDHVDILGNAQLMEDILRIAAGHGHVLEERTITDIASISQDVAKRIGDL